MRFRTVDADFCFACVEGPGDLDKQNFLMTWLECWLRFEALGRNRRGAVVFDVDDTLVDRNEAPNEAVIHLYNTCKEIGLRCCIVTARPESIDNRRMTVDMLRLNGIDDWESLYMMPHAKNVDAVALSRFKRQCRDDIETRHRILANVGDMWHDLVRFPLHGPIKVIEERPSKECAVLFPPMSHGEVAVKLVAHG